MQQVAMVTGGVRRVGKALAEALARMGFDLYLHFHSRPEEARAVGLELEQRHGVQVRAFQADLARAEEIEAMFADFDGWMVSRAAASKSRPAFKVLVNSAAVMSAGRPDEISLQEWNAALDINLRAPFLVSQQAARRMPSGGLIVNITDIGAAKVWSRYTAYSVSKAGLETLTRILARALAPAIRVNAIAPGLILPGGAIEAEAWDRLVQKIPLRRTATLEEIGMCLRFLVENEYITGQSIAVDGGYSLI